MCVQARGNKERTGVRKRGTIKSRQMCIIMDKRTKSNLRVRTSMDQGKQERLTPLIFRNYGNITTHEICQPQPCCSPCY
jgi:hypothetical protein